jgi:hypothetical protein
LKKNNVIHKNASTNFPEKPKLAPQLALSTRPVQRLDKASYGLKNSMGCHWQKSIFRSQPKRLAGAMASKPTG